MARRTKQEAEETRRKVMAAALDIIYEKGYARSTFVDVAGAIGLSKGAVYWHFKNKPDLFIALGNRAGERIESLMKAMLDKTDTLPELKAALCEMILLMSQDAYLRKYYTIVYYRMEWTEELISIKQFFDEQDRLMEQWILGILETARSRGDIAGDLGDEALCTLATALYGVVGGLLAHALSESIGSTEERDRVSNVVQTGLDVFFRGIPGSRE